MLLLHGITIMWCEYFLLPINAVKITIIASGEKKFGNYG